MKYFIDAAAREASGHENYYEFQNACPTEDIWDAGSLYMSGEVMEESGFGEFWEACVTELGFGFMDTIYAPDWAIMVREAKRIGGTVLEVVNELSPWLEAQYATGTQHVGVVDEFERELVRRRRQREAFTVDPRFYEEVRATVKTPPTAESQEAYEALLRKYNMPQCFFPIEMSPPEEPESDNEDKGE